MIAHTRRLRMRVVIVFLTSFAWLGHPIRAAAQVQSMAILPGAVVNFVENVGSAIVDALCTDVSRHTPTTSDAFTNLAGDVRLTFKDGVIRELPFEQTTAFLRVTGANDHTGVRLVRNDPNLQKVEFLTPAVAHPKDTPGFEQAKAFAAEIGAHNFGSQSPAAMQQWVWRNTFTGRAEQTPLGPAFTYQYRYTDPQHQMVQRVLDLQGRGDAMILTTPGGKTLVIDSGLSAASGERIKVALGTPTHGLMITTHPDADHLGNAVPILEAGVGNWDAVLTSTFPSTSNKAAEYNAALDRAFADRVQLPGADIALYRPDGSWPMAVERRTISPALAGKASPISVYDVAVEPSVDVQLWQLRSASSANQSSVITRVTHNGYTTMYLGDADSTVLGEIVRTAKMQRDAPDLIAQRVAFSFESQMTASERQHFNRSFAELKKVAPPADAADERELREYALITALEDRLGDEMDEATETAVRKASEHALEFRADMLKWPHHAALPRTQAQRQAYGEFLQLANPRVIVLSTTDPELRGQDIEAVKSFVKEWLPEAEVRVTAIDGTIRWISQLLNGPIDSLQLRLPEGSGATARSN